MRIIAVTFLFVATTLFARSGPPREAINACSSKSVNSACSFEAPHGTISGTCLNKRHGKVCVPERMSRGKSVSSKSTGKQLMDVHGAGAQRSDPKSGSTARYSGGHGPQGDIVRINNYVRCVRGSSTRTNLYTVVSTGQKNCYSNRGKINCPKSGSAYYGQDANYNSESFNYRDNGDGTVTDSVTGLTWTKAFYKVSWGDSFKLAKSVRVGGKSDWRVPTIKELYSLMNFNGSTGTGNHSSSSRPADAVPYLDSSVFSFEYPTTSRFIDAQYITSTAYVGRVMRGSKAFFGVNFADGRIKGYPQVNRRRSTYYVRFVRGNRNYGNNQFGRKGNRIVDTSTGLVWTRADSGPRDWGSALNYCEGLVVDGKSDWRLPNAKELHTIVDYTRSPDTTGSAAIDPIFQSSSYRNEKGQKDYGYYWSSTTHLDGRNHGERAVYISFGRALGNM